MNDEIMYACRPRVRAAFSERLYQQLNQTEKGYVMEKHMNGRTHLNWKLALTALLIAVTGVFTFSSKARVFAGDLIDEIAGFFVEERSENPLTEYFDVDGVLDVPNATVVYFPAKTLDSILENPPFEFSMPEYIPEGFEIKANEAAEAPSGGWVNVPYRSNTRGKDIIFMAETGTPTLSIGSESSEEIKINNESALLVRGEWSRDGSHTWDYDSGLTIYWTVNNTNYRLILRGIEEDLLDGFLIEFIKMAESVH